MLAVKNSSARLAADGVGVKSSGRVFSNEIATFLARGGKTMSRAALKEGS